jgi:hypothetical protein
MKPKNLENILHKQVWLVRRTSNDAVPTRLVIYITEWVTTANEEAERMWKEAIVKYLKVLDLMQYLLGGFHETH